MAYGTPGYDYAQAQNQLTQSKGAQDVSAAYGRFLGQERFRRQGEQANEGFRRQFPKVGQQYNQRGLWNSGQRQQGQQQYAQDFERGRGNAQFEHEVWNQQQEMADIERQSQYLMALQQMFQNMQAGRASGFDPYAAIRPQVGG